MAVQRRQPAPQPLVEVARARRRPDQLQHQERRQLVRRPTPRARPGRAAPPPRPARRAPAPPRRTCRWARGRCIFTNSRRPSASADLEGLVDVAAGERRAPSRPATPSAAASAASSRASIPPSPAAPPRPRALARRWSSSPRQAALADVEHLLEAARPAVVRVGHVGVGRRARVERPQQAPPWRARPARARHAQQLVAVRAVHREHVIEARRSRPP